MTDDEDLLALDLAIGLVGQCCPAVCVPAGAEYCVRVIAHLDDRLRTAWQRPRVPTSEQVALSMLKSAALALDQAAADLELAAKWVYDLTYVGGGTRTATLKARAQQARRAAQGLM